MSINFKKILDFHLTKDRSLKWRETVFERQAPSRNVTPGEWLWYAKAYLSKDLSLSRLRHQLGKANAYKPIDLHCFSFLSQYNKQTTTPLCHSLLEEAIINSDKGGLYCENDNFRGKNSDYKLL